MDLDIPFKKPECLVCLLGDYTKASIVGAYILYRQAKRYL